MRSREILARLKQADVEANYTEGEFHQYAVAIMWQLQEIIRDAGLFGYWVIPSFPNDEWIDGIEIGCPDGRRIGVPEAEDGGVDVAKLVTLIQAEARAKTRAEGVR